MSVENAAVTPLDEATVDNLFARLVTGLHSTTPVVLFDAGLGARRQVLNRPPSKVGSHLGIDDRSAANRPIVQYFQGLCTSGQGQI